MKQSAIKKLEADHPEIIVMESEANSLQYLFDDDKSRFAISGIAEHYWENGCILTVERALELVNIMKHGIDKLPQYDGRYIIFGKGRSTSLNKKQATALRNELADVIDMRKTITERKAV